MMRFTRHHFLRATVAAALVSATGLCIAQTDSYPAKTVKVLVPYSAGSNPDVVARIVAQRLAERMGQAFFIENRVGAGGSIGLGYGAKAAPDGYTLVVAHVGGLAINPSVYEKLPYDPIKDFVPVTQFVKSPLVLSVPASSPITSPRELIAQAKSCPTELTFSSGGNGSLQQMAGEYFNSLAAVKMAHIPFKTAPDSVLAVAKGDVALSFGSQASSWPLVKSGKLRALGVTSDTRLPGHADIPALAEILPGFELYDWSGLMVPAGTPQAIVDKLQKEISAVLSMPEVVTQLQTQGLMPVQSSSAQFKAFIAAEQHKWSTLAKRVGIRLD